LDLRQKVVEAYVNKEGSIRKLAERFKISKNAVSSFIARFRSTGNVTPKHREVPGNPAKVDKERAHYLTEVLHREPDLTLEPSCASDLKCTSANRLAPRPWIEGLKSIRSRVKKTFYDPKKCTDHVKHLILDYFIEVKKSPAEDLIFLDETGAGVNMRLA
jgi:hypothetical protein